MQILYIMDGARPLYILDGARPLYILGGTREAATWAVRGRAKREAAAKQVKGLVTRGGNYGIIVKQLKQ